MPSRDHAHHASLPPPDPTFRFGLGIALNITFVLIEAAAGIASGSLALLADAGHNLSDVLALLIAWGASVLARRRPTPRFTYGLRGSSIWAALANAIILLVACGGIAWEAIRRLQQPSEVSATTVIVVAAIGVVVNTATALLFLRGRHRDLNVRGAFLHMAGDAAISFGVALSGLLLAATGWY
jgi:cobalt-zinc-cadmium efflux system protein